VERLKANLSDHGLYLREVRIWAEPEAAAMLWFKAMLRARNTVYRQWVNDILGDKRRAYATPDQCRKSLTLQRRVRAWYLKHGWIKAFKHHGRSTFQIDPWACLRYYSDEWHKSPEGKGKDSPWKGRQVDRRARRKAIDDRFSTAQHVGII
jgi:hypothetical protein